MKGMERGKGKKKRGKEEKQGRREFMHQFTKETCTLITLCKVIQTHTKQNPTGPPRLVCFSIY